MFQVLVYMPVLMCSIKWVCVTSIQKVQKRAKLFEFLRHCQKCICLHVDYSSSLGLCAYRSTMNDAQIPSEGLRICIATLIIILTHLANYKLHVHALPPKHTGTRLLNASYMLNKYVDTGYTTLPMQ